MSVPGCGPELPFKELPLLYRLLVTIHFAKSHISLRWSTSSDQLAAEMIVSCGSSDELTWDWRVAGGAPVESRSPIHRGSIKAKLRRLNDLFPLSQTAVAGAIVDYDRDGNSIIVHAPKPVVPPNCPTWVWVESEIARMAQQLRPRLARIEQAERAASELPGHHDGRGEDREPEGCSDEPFIEWLDGRKVKMQKRAEQELARRAEARASIEAERKRRRDNEKRREADRQVRSASKAGLAKPPAEPSRPRAPLPAVPLSIETPVLELQETLLPTGSLHDYFLRERAALWWVSNQADDLLCLPYCKIERLEYQIRTALRVIGALRGRALLSDEVGLGKTIESGLVLKEYLTRGMVKRFLVITVPSLVDQWEEELADKFDLTVATTNQPAFRSDPAAFWREQKAIVASLHTLKQPGHLSIAQSITWDMLIVDEAHHLRNQSSQAWQAVNALPRQFLLLLTATPVQNSLDELYNLVTLLQPGHLPSPKEFRARFIDKEKPHRPRQPEELRRLLSQVMIRNTRANAGINLPPRRAETVLFDPAPAEREFWQQWDIDFRNKLGEMNASQAALWGRLLLQSAGSSPAAWRQVLTSFPDKSVARSWSARAPLDESWAKKCQSILPLAKNEGGVVVFTQFLHTQAALADFFQQANVPAFVVNGAVPAADRQPLVERFRQTGGVLLLTQSGTEGRNLQFCHRLVNFDLPWNPMEIEQRIGRLHRLGQQHPVRIYNLVQTGTLQEHLLNILQDKLNLFELVVGETGLILGERFGSDEFADEVLRRWRESEGRVAEAMQTFGEELAAARANYDDVRQLDETLFSDNYESL